MYINYFLTNICSFRIIILRIIVDWGNVVHDPYHMDVCMCAYTVAYEIEFYHNARQSHIYLIGNFVEMPIIQKNVDLLEHFPSIFFFFINYSLLPFALIKLHRVSRSPNYCRGVFDNNYWKWHRTKWQERKQRLHNSRATWIWLSRHLGVIRYEFIIFLWVFLVRILRSLVEWLILWRAYTHIVHASTAKHRQVPDRYRHFAVD